VPASQLTEPQRQKQQLRQRYRAARGRLSRAQRQAHTPALNRHLLEAEPVRAAARIGAYLAFDGEPDLRFSMTQLHRRGVTVAVPVVEGAQAPAMRFAPWHPATPLDANRFGISEPTIETSLEPAELDLLLIPLVAFDLTGGRLGMGGGYYDRLLSGFTEQPLRVGVGWSLQEHEQLPLERWDVSLHAVVTEQGWFTCRR